MNDLATQLRNAVLGVLMDNGGPQSMTADDYAFLNAASSFGQTRMAGDHIASSSVASIKAALAKPDTAAEQRPGETGAPITLQTQAPIAAGEPMPEGGTVIATADDQAKLPLGEADRGPEPQDVGSLIDTAAPADTTVNQEEQPPDYTRLSPTKG